MEEPQDLGVTVTDSGKRGTEDELASLHGVVASYLKAVILTGSPPPALVGAAIAFLKNNAITASASQNEALKGLSEALKQRRTAKGGLTKAAAEEASDQFSRLMGGSFPGGALN